MSDGFIPKVEPVAQPDFQSINLGEFLGALFAQGQLPSADAPLQPAYSYAQQGKVAQLEVAVSELRKVPTTGGVQVTLPADRVLTATYLGAVDPAGQLPFTLVVLVELLGLDATDDPRTEVIFTPYGLTGSEIVEGSYEVTGVSRDAAQLKVVVNFAGVKQGEWNVQVLLRRAAPPPAPTPTPTPTPSPTPTPTPPPPPAQSPAGTVYLENPNSTAFALLGEAPVNGGYGYKITLNSDFKNVSGTGTKPVTNLQVYAAYRRRDGTTWTQFGATVTGEPNVYEEGDPFDKWGGQLNPWITQQYPGYISIAESVVLPVGPYVIGLFGRLLYGPPVNLSAPAVVEPI